MIRVACLGAGYFSQFHLDGWRRLSQVELVGVADRDPDRAAASGAPAFNDAETMLTATRPDILDIILPPPGHAEAIRAGLAHGVRAIICQKPFCTSPQEARAMADLAESAGIPLIVHENFRFQPWYRAIRDSLAKGAIGQVQQATFRLRTGDGQGPQAYLDRQPYFRDMPRFLIHETGVHWVDTFRFLFGNPTAVYADLRRVNPGIRGEDAGFVLFDHPGGVRVLFDGNRCLDHAAENTRCTMGEALVEGDAGTLTLTGDGALHHRAFGATKTIRTLAPDTSGRFGGDCTFHLQAHVIEAFLEERPFENAARDYLDVQVIEAAIYRSAETGAKITIAP